MTTFHVMIIFTTRTTYSTTIMAILASGNIGFTDVQTLITQLLSYFRVVANPKAVFLTTEAITDNSVSDVNAQNRLKEMVDETLELASKLRQG